MSTHMGQEGVVREHFKVASTTWGDRYARRPQKMSDLDLLLRKRNVQRLVRAALAHHPGPAQVLDLGCGSGNVLEGLLSQSVKIIGMDIVPEMVAAAARSNPSEHYLVGDATALPLALESVDLVTCIGVLEYIPDAAQALESIHQTLRPNGHLVISFPNRTSLFRKLSKLESRTERLLVALRNRLRGRGGQPIAVPKYHHTQWSTRAAWRLLESAGFEICDAAFNTYGLWGWFGRRRWSLQLCEWMSGRFHRRNWVSSSLACTMVVLARKTE